MKTLCFYFQVHQPFRLKNYRFFNIGHDHYYYDDYANESIIRKIAEKAAADKKSQPDQNNTGGLPAGMHSFSFCGAFLFSYRCHIYPQPPLLFTAAEHAIHTEAPLQNTPAVFASAIRMRSTFYIFSHYRMGTAHYGRLSCR